MRRWPRKGPACGSPCGRRSHWPSRSIARVVVRTVALCTLSLLCRRAGLGGEAARLRHFRDRQRQSQPLAGSDRRDGARPGGRDLPGARGGWGGSPTPRPIAPGCRRRRPMPTAMSRVVSGQKADACSGAALPGGGPWYLANGITNFSGTLDELTGPERILYRPVMLDENLVEVAAGVDQIWTGTFADGVANLTCSDWTSASAGIARDLRLCAALGPRLDLFELGRLRRQPPPPLPRARTQRGHDSRLESGFAGLRLFGDRRRGPVQLARRRRRHRARRRRQRLSQSRRRGAPAGAAVVHRLALRQPTGRGGPLDLEWTVPPRRRLRDRELQGRSPGRLGRQQHPCLRERQLRGRSPVYRVDGDGGRRDESGSRLRRLDLEPTGASRSSVSGDSTGARTAAWTNYAIKACDATATRLYCFSNTLTLFWDGFENGSRSPLVLVGALTGGGQRERRDLLVPLGATQGMRGPDFRVSADLPAGGGPRAPVADPPVRFRALVLCALPVLAALSAAPASAVNRRAFVTSVAGNGNLFSGSWPGASGATSLDRADSVCRARAAAGGLPNATTYRAWLSTSSTDAYCHVQGLTGKKATGCGGGAQPGAGPWYIQNGITPFSPSLAELTGPEKVIYRPVLMDEFGDEPAYEVGDYWTGTTADGEHDGESCLDWTSSNAAEFGVRGHVQSSAYGWTGGASFTCDSPLRLLCLEPGASAPFPPRLVAGGAGVRHLADRAGRSRGLAAGGRGDRARGRRRDLPEPGRGGPSAGARIVRRLALGLDTRCARPGDRRCLLPACRSLSDRRLARRPARRLRQQQSACRRARQPRRHSLRHPDRHLRRRHCDPRPTATAGRRSLGAVRGDLRAARTPRARTAGPRACSTPATTPAGSTASRTS